MECGPYDYSRSGNPTRTQLEAHIAQLEARLSFPLSPASSSLGKIHASCACLCFLWDHSDVSSDWGAGCVAGGGAIGCVLLDSPVLTAAVHGMSSDRCVWGVLQGAARSFAFGSGMAALSAVLRLVRSGEHVVAGDDIYGGTSRLLTRIAPDLGISVSNVDTSDAQCATPAALACSKQQHAQACDMPWIAGTQTTVVPDKAVS